MPRLTPCLVTRSPQGYSGFSFSDARMGKGLSYLIPFARAVGVLFFTVNGEPSRCSASLIGKSLLVTAAHCVCDFAGNFYTDHVFIVSLGTGNSASQPASQLALAKPHR
jgi:hypothetical protein